jgi:hypothetical protein
MDKKEERVERTGAVGAEEELAIAGDNGVEEGASVLGGLGRRFAVVVLDNSQKVYSGSWMREQTYNVGGPVVN